VLPVTKRDHSPQNHDQDREWESTPIHEQMKKKNVNNHWAEKHKPQHYVTIRQQQYSSPKL